MDFTRKIFIGVFGVAITALGTCLSLTPPEFTGARYALAAAAISLLATYVGWVLSYPGMVRSQLFYGLFVAFILVFGVVYGVKWIDYREKTYPKTPVYAGILNPLKLIDNGEIKDVKVQIGNSRIRLESAAVLDNLLRAWGKDKFTVELLNNNIFVSTKIHDNDGNIIAELDKNEWKIKPSPGTWDRNYTDDALEVKDASGSIILQIRVVPGIIEIQGAWWLNFPDIQLRFVIQEDSNGGASFRLCGSRQSCIDIKSIFKYPSENHLGEMLE